MAGVHMGAIGGGGGTFSGGGSTSGANSTLSKEDNLVLSSEVSSNPNGSELDLGLGLSLGGVGAGSTGGGMKARQTVSQGQYARFLTAEDFPSVISQGPCSASSSSSSYLNRDNASAGTKRSADSVASGNGISPVVGWPPLRTSRLNSMVNQSKSPAAEESKPKSKNTVAEKTYSDSKKNRGDNAMEKGQCKNSMFVKVYMDGIPIGRKVDLNAHTCYETLAQSLEDMFNGPGLSVSVTSGRSSSVEHDMLVEPTRPSSLLSGSSKFVLTYEDKDGDLMLVGDVPWRVFLKSVKRLRIMKTSETNGPATRFQEKNGEQRSNPI